MILPSPEFIKNRLSQDLPGKVAQSKLSPVEAARYYDIADDHKKAGVLLLISQGEVEPIVTFMIRASGHPDDKHAGQISFPGGKKEEDDDTMISCAQRETHEEIGVPPEQYEILGILSDLYVYVSNFLITPVVAYSSLQLHFIPEENEVAGLIHYPLSGFYKFKNLKKKDLKIRQGIMKDVPYFDLDGQVLWGATSMIMAEFISLFLND
jgi:8-oxo-dGTP pyrophosphatase MutT (NUDIX family)